MNSIFMKVAACLVACTSIVGCNGFPTPFVNDPVYSQYFVVNSGPPLPLMFQGSAVQWNDEYAVTAKHIPFLWKVAHEGRGDLVFFKRKSQHPPLWRQYVGGEELTASGLSPFLVSVKGTGHALASRVQILEFKDGVSYGIGDMPLVKGMSGGPVFGSDNKVVGINIGFISSWGYKKSVNPEIAGADRVSIFIPYDEILKDWEIFQNEDRSKPHPAMPASSIPRDGA